MPPVLARDLVPGPAPHQLSLVAQSRGAAVHEAIELDGTHRVLACQAPGPAKQPQWPGRQALGRRSSLTVRIELWRSDSCSTSSPLHSTSLASPLSTASGPSASARHFPDYAPKRLSSAPEVLQHPKLERRSFVRTIQGFVRALSAPKSTFFSRKEEQEFVCPFLQQSRPPRLRTLSFWDKLW